MKKQKEKIEPITIENFGVYRMGLTADEVEEYVLNYAQITGGKWTKMKKRKLMDKYWEIFGVNTCAVGPDNQSLFYRWDIKRFAQEMFNNIPTCWD